MIVQLIPNRQSYEVSWENWKVTQKNYSQAWMRKVCDRTRIRHIKKTSGKSFVENILSYVYNAGHYSFIIWTIVN